MPQSIVQYDKELPYIENRQPWEVPICYLKKKSGNEYEMVDGRRPSKMLMVNKLRVEIDKWRNDAYREQQQLHKSYSLIGLRNRINQFLETNHFIFISVNVRQ